MKLATIFAILVQYGQYFFRFVSTILEPPSCEKIVVNFLFRFKNVLKPLKIWNDRKVVFF